MTAAQKSKVSELQLQGFSIINTSGDLVRMKRGPDERYVRTDGSQKRAVRK
jgi:hypothetical protein